MARGAVFKQKRIAKDGGKPVGDPIAPRASRGPQTYNGRSNLRGPQGTSKSSRNPK